MKHSFRLLAAAAVILTSVTAALGDDGYFDFIGTPASRVWENFSNETFHRAQGTVNVTFYWGQANMTPAVDAILPFTPTNALSDIGASGWNAILNDPNFQEATNANTGLAAITTVTGPGGGLYTYNGGLVFPIVGTAPINTYTVYVVGWDATYSTPQAAAAAGSALGWSIPVQYFANTATGVPESFGTAGIGQFGVTVPEPCAPTVIVAGIATWLRFRRRK